MLGKLIKHEFRATSRFLLPLHILLLVACFFGRFITQSAILRDIPTPLLIVTVIFYLSILVIIPCATWMLLIVRYYKSLYTDEGYLALTLPVSRGQLLFSKAFTAIVWTILDFICVLTGCAIMIMIKPILEHSDLFMLELEKGLEMDPVLFFWTTVLLSIVGCFSSIAVSYFCISLGQLLSSHRVLGAIVSYFTISSIVSVISLVLVVLLGFNPFSSEPPGNLMLEIYWISGIFAIFEAAVFFIGTYFLLKKKTNLN